MNIHEYQAKAILRELGAPVARGVPAFTVEEAEKAANQLPGPVRVVKAQIHAGGRGKGRFKEDEAGDKGGVRLARFGRRRGRPCPPDAGQDAGHQAERRRRPGGAPSLHRRRLGDRPRALPVRPGRPRLGPRRLHRLGGRRHGHRGGGGERTGEDRHRPCRSGRRLQPAYRHDHRLCPRSLRQRGQAVRGADRQALCGDAREGHEPARDQPAGGDRGRRPHLPRRQDQLRRQRALPPSGHRRPARPGRGGSARDRGGGASSSTTSRSTAPSAAWSMAPASPWRRWTSSSSTVPSPRTSSMSAAAPRASG